MELSLLIAYYAAVLLGQPVGDQIVFYAAPELKCELTPGFRWVQGNKVEVWISVILELQFLYCCEKL